MRLIPDTLQQLRSQLVRVVLDSQVVPDILINPDDLVIPDYQMNLEDRVPPYTQIMVIPDGRLNSYSQVLQKSGLDPVGQVHPYTLTTPDRLTNLYGRVLPDSQLNLDSLLL